MFDWNAELFALAQNSKEFIAGVLIPLVVLWLGKLTWKGEHKFALAAGISLLAGFITAWTDGSLTASTVMENLTVILSVSQGVYFGAFKALGLERIFFPKEAVLDDATQQVKDQVDTMSDATAKDVADKSTPTTVDVNVTTS